MLIDPLLRTRQLNVHVAINADQAAFIFGLAPFKSDDNLFVDPVRKETSAGFSIASIAMGGLWTYSPWSIGRGLIGMNCEENYQQGRTQGQTWMEYLRNSFWQFFGISEESCDEDVGA